MGKELPNVAFRRTKADPHALQAFIDSGTITEPTVAAPTPVPLALVRQMEERPSDGAIEAEGRLSGEAVEPTPAVQENSKRAEAVTAKTAPPIARNIVSRPSASVAKKGYATKRQILQRVDGRELRKRTVYFSATTSLTLDIVCAQQQRDLSDVVQEALTMWLAKNS